MNKESIIKLIKSRDDTNIQIALELLVGKSKKEIQILFDIPYFNAHTLIKGLNLNNDYSRSYRISNDCVIYLGVNMSIGREAYQHIDLTI